MELFNLLATLTLDASDFDSGIDDAQKKADSFTVPENPKLGIDTSDYNSKLDEAKGKGSEFGEAMKEIFQGVKSAVLVGGVTAAITGVISSFQQGIDLITTGGDKIDKQSKKLNLSTKAYQELNYALGLSGASVDDLSMGMRKFTQIQGGKITKDQAAAFEQLGISAEKANGQMKSAEDLMTETMYALADYSGDDRGVLAEAFFGKSADKFNALFSEGSEGIKAMRKEAEDLGLILSDQDIKNAAEYMDATDKLSQTVNGLKMDLASSIVPGLTNAAKMITTVVSFLTGKKDKSLSDMFADDDKQLASDLTTIEGTAAAAETLVDKLLAMGNTAEMTAEQYAVWKGTAEELISLVPTLGEVINTETGEIEGNTESIKANIKAWEDMAKAKALQSAKEKKWQEIVDKNEQLINKQVEANVKAADAEKARVQAYQKFSDEMQNRGYGSLDMSGDVDQQISDLMSSLAENGDEAEADLLALGLALKQIGEASTEAAKAKKEAEDLSKEIEQAKADYEAWSAAADQLFGTLDSDAASASSQVDGLQSAIDGLPDEKHITISVDTVDGIPNAKGNWSVPYDGFPAILHRGERVLTASQARHGEGEGSADPFAVAAAVGGAVKKAMGDIGVYIDGNKAGDMTTKRVQGNINAENYAKKRAYGG